MGAFLEAICTKWYEDIILYPKDVPDREEGKAPQQKTACFPTRRCPSRPADRWQGKKHVERNHTSPGYMVRVVSAEFYLQEDLVPKYMIGYFFPIEFSLPYHRKKQNKTKLYFKTQKNPNRKSAARCRCRGNVSQWEGRDEVTTGQEGSLTSRGCRHPSRNPSRGS